MVDFNKAFEAKNGFLVEDGPFFTGGVASPVGLDLPVGTFYGQTSSTGLKIWRKYNTGINDWTLAENSDFSQHVEAVAETSTTSTTVWSTKLTLTTPSLPLGDYEVTFMYKWRNSSANRRQDTRIQVNSANKIAWESFNSNTAEQSLQSGFFLLESVSGVQTITFQFKVVGSGTTTYTSEARMKIKRLS
jgi:hypothetical protein